MSSAAKYTPRYTVADYTLGEGEWEFCNGATISASPRTTSFVLNCQSSVELLLKNTSLIQRIQILLF